MYGMDVDSTPQMWTPHDHTTLTSAGTADIQPQGYSIQNHQNHGPAGYPLQNGSQGHPAAGPRHYNTYNPRHQSYSDAPPACTTFKSRPPYGEGTWPRSSQRATSSDQVATPNPAPPTRGLSLHTIREQDAATPHPRPWEEEHDGDRIHGDRRNSPPPSYDQAQGPSMTNGMSTTVPQSMVQHNLNCSHQPTLRRSRPAAISKLTGENRENLEMKCCRITVLLVVMQICLGTTITALGFYMERLTSSFTMRECPYWAGIPVLVAGVVGLYYCATDFEAYAGSMRAFVIKVLCFIFSTVSIFLCIVAAIFPGIHGHRIPLYSSCEMNGTNLSCVCRQEWNEYYREYRYDDIDSCVTIQTSVKDYLILQCALNAIASGVCLWFVTMLWKQRYEDFHSGLRFYSYSASVPPHP